MTSSERLGLSVVPGAGWSAEDIRSVAMMGGARSAPEPALTAIAKRTASQLRCMPEGTLRLMNPHRYRVALSPELHALRLKLIEMARPA